MSPSKSGIRAALVVLILTICATAGVNTAFGRSPDKTTAKENREVKEIEKTFDVYVRAWNTGDYAALAGIYANDSTVSVFWPDPARPQLLVGWPRISSNLKDIFERVHGLDLDFNDRQIHLYGETAVLTSSWVWHHPADPAFGTGRVTFVFHWRDNKWWIVHEHSSVTPFDSK
jgi:ketosteroid isomerase-like protein